MLPRPPLPTRTDTLFPYSPLFRSLGLVQGGVLEIHPWGARLDDLEKPDLINMDLDPGPGVDWSAIVVAAGEVRERLREAGLESFVKTSGDRKSTRLNSSH